MASVSKQSRSRILQLTASPEHVSTISSARVWITALVAINAFMLCARLMLVGAIRSSYGERGWTFFSLSWLAGIPAAVRLTLITAKPPRVWRGRMYQQPEQLQA